MPLIPRRVVASVSSLRDLTRLPMVKNYPDYLPCDWEGGRVYLSGGTGGIPKAVPYSRLDWRTNVEYRARCLQVAGVGASSIVAVILPYGPWSTGDSVEEASRLLGALPISVGFRPKAMAETLSILEKLSVSHIVTTPSMARLISDSNSRPKPVNFILTGEYLSPRLRERLQAVFRGSVTGMYAVTEAIIGIECSCGDGYHFWDDMLVVEVTDASGQCLPPGQVGSVCLTKLTGDDAVSLVRYCPGDLGGLVAEPCSCGLPFPRLRFHGREGNRFTLFGAVTCSIHQIRTGLNHLPFGVYGIGLTIEDGKDSVEILRLRIESERRDERAVALVRKAVSHVSIDIADALASETCLLKVELVEPGALGSGGQARKFVETLEDLRKEPL